MTDQLRPQMTADDAEEYTAALGQIMAGGWRQIALAQRLGVPEAIGLTTEAWVRDRIGGYVRLGLDQRREAVKALTDPEGDFGLTQRQAAEVLGVAQKTVSRDLHDESYDSSDTGALGEDGEGIESYDSPEESAEPSVDAEPDQPTMGEILGGESLVFDDSGLHEAAARRKRYEHANTVLDYLIDLTTRYGPEVLVEHERPDRLPTLAKTLAPLIAWLERAQQLASDPRTQIRSLP